ncbi:MAG TPA: polyprenol phosphomannose-dependent alpha 1,6 mannosyltransferase MptB [Acidimicrobiales bacterium]|jgi:hypothetical protein
MAIDFAPDAPAPPARARRRGIAGPYPAIGFVGALLIAVTAPTWKLAFIGTHEPWRLTVPGLPHDGTRPFTAIAFVAGAALLGIAWLGLIGRIEASKATSRERMRAVIATALLWFAPVMLGPPLLSSDIYSYAAEGEMVTQGHDPTSEGMFKLHYGDFVAHVDPVWRVPYGGNPYGPVQMGIAAGAVYATGHSFEPTIWLLRAISLAAVLLSIWAISDIAKRHGVSPPVAVAIGIANPIAVLHLVGGGHNDAILMALLLTGFAVAERGRFWWGVVLVTLAAAVKLPAAAGIVYLAWCQPGAGAAVKERLRTIAKAFAVMGTLMVALCAFVGIGFGWITAIRNTGTTTGTLSLPTRLGFVISGMFHAVGLPSSDQLWIALLRFVGLAIAAYICLRLFGVVQRIGYVAATGICLLAVMLLGPVVWPWYLAPGFALLGTTRLGRWRASMLVLCALFAAEVFPVGVKSKPVLEGNHLVSLLLIVVIGIVSALAPMAVDRWHDGSIQRWVSTRLDGRGSRSARELDPESAA